MKIISGALKGMVIPRVKNPKYRPSTGKFKESLFSILGSIDKDLFIDKLVLDLFAGTGSLGLEALSRGANRVTFIDIENDHIQAIKAFLQKITNLVAFDCLRLDGTNLPKSHTKYDIIFIDPPYSKNLAPKALKSLVEKGWLNKNSIIILELERNEVLVVEDLYDIMIERLIGRAKLMILRYLDEAI